MIGLYKMDRWLYDEEVKPSKKDGEVIENYCYSLNDGGTTKDTKIIKTYKNYKVISHKEIVEIVYKKLSGELKGAKSIAITYYKNKKFHGRRYKKFHGRRYIKFIYKNTESTCVANYHYGILEGICLIKYANIEHYKALHDGYTYIDKSPFTGDVPCPIDDNTMYKLEYKNGKIIL